MSTEHTKTEASRNAKPGPAKKQVKRPAKKPRRKAPASANELMLEAWKYNYENRHKRVD